MGGGYSTVDDLARFADALIANRLLSREMTARVLTGYIDAEYGGRDAYGFETRLFNGVKMASHRGALAGTSNQVEFYPISSTPWWFSAIPTVMLPKSSRGAREVSLHRRPTRSILASRPTANSSPLRRYSRSMPNQ